MSKPKMTRAHYQLIAGLLNDMLKKAAWCMDDDMDRIAVVQFWTYALADTNDSFDVRKFMEACFKDINLTEDK